jgi:lysophospholipase L1-like esterase
VIPILRRRAGLPRVRRLVSAGEPVTIVAFGTSMTLGGHYLDRLPGALRAKYANERITLINRGRNGYSTLGAAFRVNDDVLPYAPDLVLIEFAHNDTTWDLVNFTARALEGMLAQIRRARPKCEFVFVYLALPGAATYGPTPAIAAYEEVAERHGISAIDVATFAETLVAQGAAVWEGAANALTVDGIHHAPVAAELIGGPFAEAFVQLLAGDGDAAPIPAVPAGALAPLTRVAAAACERAGNWAIRGPRAGEERGAGIDEEGFAEALEPGATLRIAFTGTDAFAWASGSGVFGVRVAETDERFRVGIEAPGKWNLRALIPPHPAARYSLDIIALNAGLVLGDLNFVGTPG